MYDCCIWWSFEEKWENDDRFGSDSAIWHYSILVDPFSMNPMNRQILVKLHSWPGKEWDNRLWSDVWRSLLTTECQNSVYLGRNMAFPSFLGRGGLSQTQWSHNVSHSVLTTKSGYGTGIGLGGPTIADSTHRSANNPTNANPSMIYTPVNVGHQRHHYPLHQHSFHYDGSSQQDYTQQGTSVVPSQFIYNLLPENFTSLFSINVESFFPFVAPSFDSAMKHQH